MMCSPYLVLSLTLEPTVIAGMLTELDNAPTSGRSVSGFTVSDATPDLFYAWLRMMRLSDRPKEIAMPAERS